MDHVPLSHLEQRLLAAEESALFAERTSERLRDDLEVANREILDLQRRLARLETRLQDVEEHKAQVIDPSAETRPPHATGPRVPEST